MFHSELTPGVPGFETITYPESIRPHVARANAAWVRFCALPLVVKQRFPYLEDTRLSGVGYEYKDGNGADRKEDFHLNLKHAASLRASAQAVAPEAVDFVDAALSLVAHLKRPVITFAGKIEVEHHVPLFVDDTSSSMDLWMLRFLHYFGDCVAGEEMAAPHPDKGGCTFHLIESHPGLEYLTADNRWLPMPVSETNTVFIPGLRLQHRSRNRLLSTWHRVVATEETARNGRYSAVCFIDFLHTHYYDKQRNGRTQGLVPGSTYSMSYEEFAQLFSPW